MVLFNRRTSLLMISILLGLIAILSTGIRVRTQQKPNVNPTNNGTYPVAPPPKGIDPLPDDQDMQEREAETDYRN